MATQYKGTCDNQRQPEGGRTIADTITRRVVIKGKKTTMEAFQIGAYAQGQTFEIEWMILSTDLADMVGGMAKLTLNLVLKGTTTNTYTDALETTWEINWMSVEKPLTSNPKLVAQGSGTAQTVVDLVAAWKDSPQQRKRKYQVPLSTLTREADPLKDADWEDLPAAGEALKVCQKLAAGIEGYLVFAPVITKTSIYSYRMDTYDGSCGKIQTPSVNVAGFEYLKNGDRLNQESRKTWKRVEIWQGAETWDTDLYDNA